MTLTSKAVQYGLAIILVVTVQFWLVKSMPGDPLIHILGEEGYFLASQNPEEMNRLRAEYGLDGAVLSQYVSFLSRLAKGDLGWSASWNAPVGTAILNRLPGTLLLMAPALLISTTLSAIFGLLAAWYREKRIEKISTALLLLIYAIPGYCLAIGLLAVSGVWDGLLPAGRVGSMIPPCAVLVFHGTAYKFFIMKNASLAVLEQEYIITAVSKGVSPFQLLRRHVFPNVLPQLATLFALSLGHMISGALLVEIVFSWNGMGTLIAEAVSGRDHPLLAGAFTVLTLCVIGANAVADAFHRLVDPRVGDRANED